MKGHTAQDIEALTNWDGLLCKKPWRNEAEKRQYYARYINRLLWRYFAPEDWQNVSEIIDEIRVSDKLKLATKFLAQRHTTK